MVRSDVDHVSNFSVGTICITETKMLVQLLYDSNTETKMLVQLLYYSNIY
jgi:hypothetical protein